MSESSLTPHTAPRTLDGLLKETPFKLRLLAQALNGLTTEDQKMAWHQLQTPEARAQYILSLLQGWDAANPGQAKPMTNGTNGAAVHQPPPQQFQPPPQYPQQPPPQQYAQPQGQPPPQQQFQAPVQTQFQMPQQNMAPVAPAQMGPPPVNAAAAAAATAATAPPTTSGRKPRSTAAAAAPTAGGDSEVAAQVLTMLQQILAGLGSDAERFQKLQANITGILEEAAAAKTGRLTVLEGKYTEVANSLQHLSAAIQSQSQVQLWTLMAFLTMAAEQTNASITDLLGAAISDSAMFQQLVDKATGKA